MHFPGAFGGGGKSMPRDCLGAVDRRPSLLQPQHPLRGDKAQGPNWITSIHPWPQRCLLASVACYQHLGSVSCPLPNPSAGAWLWVSPLTPPSSTKCPSLQIFPHPASPSSLLSCQRGLSKTYSRWCHSSVPPVEVSHCPKNTVPQIDIPAPSFLKSRGKMP